MNESKGIEKSDDNFWFPGRLVGGITMIVGPLLFLLGVSLRLPFQFFFPQQLKGYSEHPTLIFAAYSIFILGNVLMGPATLSLSESIGKKEKGWALWGGLLVIFGLFARTFHAGVDHLAFQIVNIENLESATKIVADSYGSYHIFKTFNLAIMLGWIVLAIGAYRSKVLGLARSIALGLMAALPLGVLKGTTLWSIVATVGLCIAFIPQGIKVLKDGPMPTLKKIFIWTLLTIIIIIFFIFFGNQG